MGCQGSRVYKSDTPPEERSQEQLDQESSYHIAATKKYKKKKKIKYPSHAHVFKVHCRNMPGLEFDAVDTVFFLEVKVDEGSPEKKDKWKLVAKTKHRVKKNNTDSGERDLLCYKASLNDQTELRVSAFGFRGGKEKNIYRKDLLGYILLKRYMLTQSDDDDASSEFHPSLSFAACHQSADRQSLLTKNEAQIVVRAINEKKRDQTPESPSGTKGMIMETTGGNSKEREQPEIGGKKRKEKNNQEGIESSLKNEPTKLSKQKSDSKIREDNDSSSSAYPKSETTVVKLDREKQFSTRAQKTSSRQLSGK